MTGWVPQLTSPINRSPREPGTVKPFRILAALAALALATAASGQSAPYHRAQTFTLGGDEGWDYLALDTLGHRLFIARQDRIMVLDPAAGKLLGEIPGFERAHGVAFDYASGHGFATATAPS